MFLKILEILMLTSDEIPPISSRTKVLARIKAYIEPKSNNFVNKSCEDKLSEKISNNTKETII